MSKLNRLIQELCPDGVEYRRLGEVCESICSGKNKTRVKNGNYPVFGSTGIIGYTDSFEYNQENILVARVGIHAGYVHKACGKYDVSDNALIVRPKKIYDISFAYYQLTSMCLNKNAVGGGQPLITAKKIKSISIPLPPLPVQQEIVRILDTFTELEKELEKELELRKQQYEYYLDFLLSFTNRNDIKYVYVGELFEFKNGLNKGKDYFGSGSPIVNFTDVYKNQYLSKENIKGKVNVTSKEMDLYSVYKGDVFFTRTSETKEEIGTVSVMVDSIESCVFSGFVLRARPISTLLLPEYCLYCFSSYPMRKEIIKRSSFTTRALTSGTKLSKIKIPLPPLEEQKRIVEILDRFSTLTSDISIGLPAEIAARRKQYEYYRDKLLTFEEKKEMR